MQNTLSVQNSIAVCRYPHLDCWSCLAIQMGASTYWRLRKGILPPAKEREHFPKDPPWPHNCAWDHSYVYHATENTRKEHTSATCWNRNASACRFRKVFCSSADLVWQCQTRFAYTWSPPYVLRVPVPNQRSLVRYRWGSTNEKVKPSGPGVWCSLALFCQVVTSPTLGTPRCLVTHDQN